MRNTILLAALGLASVTGLVGCQEISGLFDENRENYYYDSTHSVKSSNQMDMKANKTKSRKMASSTPEVSAPRATTVTTTAPRKGNGVPLSGPVVPQTAPTVGE